METPVDKSTIDNIKKKSISKLFIVTPCLNSQKTISRTIQSVVSQTGDFEIYYHIQDAESTDDTLSIVKKWETLLTSGSYPILCNSVKLTYNSSPDTGMYEAILKGFDSALPKEDGWLSWINADDFYMQGAFASIDKVNLSSTLPSNIEWITGACSINKETMTIASYSKVFSSHFIKLGLSDGNLWDFVQQEGTFFKRSLWDKINKTEGFTHLKYAGDWNLWRQFAEYAEIYQFKYPLASFSIRDGQLSQTARSDYEKEIECIVSSKQRLDAFKNIDGENIKSLYFSMTFENQCIEIEEKNIMSHYQQKVKSLKIDTKHINANNEALIKKQNEIKDCLKEPTVQQYSGISEQHKIINNYSLLMDKIKVLSKTSTMKHPIQKIQHYKDMLKLFYSFKYKKRRKKKVFIFTNGHGNIYKEFLSDADKHTSLEIEHLLIYKNLGNYKKIKQKFSECDILIIQPVENHENFKMENLLPLLKKDCTVIRIPSIMFNGYWDKNDVRELSKFKQSAVQFFPDINKETEVLKHINGDKLNKNQVISRFEEAISELRNLEEQADIKFVDFILENHQKIPLFRSVYHPTQAMHDFISHQLVEIVQHKVLSLSRTSFSIPQNWEKEYGHFKPIDNSTAKILGLEYDLDSYFNYSRSHYLKAILHYQNQINIKSIEDLGKLTIVLDNYDEIKAVTVHKLDNYNNCISYDKEWQFPAITEQHAFHMFRDNKAVYENDSIYVAFPWATLIDLFNGKDYKKISKRISILLDVLTQIKKRIAGKKNIVTVCQHIGMLRYQRLFSELGVTHVFWGHATKGQISFPDYSHIKISPFPLYPVQAINNYHSNIDKKYLFSFIGLGGHKGYLTKSREYIINLLSKDKRGFIQGRDIWHYNKIVYDHQITKELNTKDDLIDDKAALEFKNVASQSIFTLCPSGTGPNSIRLWESIGFGSIPVILADTYLPPGNLKLWEEAVVYCEETEEAIRNLPDRLETMAKNPEILERKRHAMRQLWMIYGPDCFVYDIKKLFLSLN